MKRSLLPVVMVLCCFGTAGCANPKQTIENAPAEIGSKLEQGLRGEGEVVEINQSDDPFIQ